MMIVIVRIVITKTMKYNDNNNEYHITISTSSYGVDNKHRDDSNNNTSANGCYHRVVKVLMIL